MQKSDSRRLEIVEGLNKLLKGKSIEDITVIELCKYVGISRTTFYTYFDDIFSIGEWFWNYGAAEILGKMGEDYGIYEGFRQLYEFLLNNKNVSARVIPERDRNSVIDYADEQSLKLHIRQLEKMRGFPLNEEEALIMRYTSSANAAVVARWIMEGMVASPEQMADIMVNIQPHFFLEAIGR